MRIGAHVAEAADRYRIADVYCAVKGVDCTYDLEWSKELLDGGAKHTQEEWVELTKGGEWSLPSIPLLYATMAGLYANFQSRKMPPLGPSTVLSRFSADLDDILMTSTRIFLVDGKDDRVVHDWGYDSQYENTHELVGGHCYVRDPQVFPQPAEELDPHYRVEEGTEAIMECRNQREIESVIKYVTGKVPMLARWEVMVRCPDGFPIVLGGKHWDSFGINHFGMPEDKAPARGVRIVGEWKQPGKD